MSALIDPRMAAFLGELAQETTKVLDKHWDAPGSTLHHHAPLSFEVHTVDGRVAEFLEDGINLYPNAPEANADADAFTGPSAEAVARVKELLAEVLSGNLTITAANQLTEAQELLS